MSAKVIDAKEFMNVEIIREVQFSGPTVEGAACCLECNYLGVYYITHGKDKLDARLNMVLDISLALDAHCVNMYSAADYIGQNQNLEKSRRISRLRRNAERTLVDALLYVRGVDVLALADGRMSAQVSELVSRLHGLVDAQGSRNEVRAEVYAGLVEEHARRLRNEADAYRDRWDSLMRRNVEDSQAVMPVQGEMPL